MDFEKDVLELSRSIPVLVDFWADWCGPCKVLGPILEELESETDKWKLVKVDVDANPELSQQFGIRGIPDVKLFKNGEVLSEFTGAKPKHEIIKWLDEVFPDDRIEILKKLIETTKKTSDPTDLQKFVQKNPDFKLGELALAKHLVWSDPDKSTQLIQSFVPGDELYSDSQEILVITQFLKSKTKNNILLDQKLTSIRIQLTNGDFDTAVEMLIEVVTIDKSYMNDLPRKLAISIFNILGMDHPTSIKYRRKFDMALY